MFTSTTFQENPVSAVDTAALQSPHTLEFADPRKGAAPPRCFEAHETIFWEGDQADYIFYVESGVVRLFKTTQDGKRQIVGFAHPGDWFGLTAGDRYSFSGDTITICRVCPFRYQDLMRSPTHGLNLLQVTMAALSTAQELMLVIGQKSALQRIAWFLLGINARRRDVGSCAQLSLPMDRVDIADYLGLTTETVCRKLTKLRTLNIIDMPTPKLFTIKDLERLEAIAEDDSA